MPIFEYVCSECKTKFEELVTKTDEKINCQKCGSDKISKVLSTFSSAVGAFSSTTPCGAPSCNSGFS